MIPAKQMDGKWILAMAIGAIMLSLVFVWSAFVILSPVQGGTLYGTLFVSSGGYSNATQSVTGSYNATLTAKNGDGQVLLTFISGNNLIGDDLLEIQNYTISINQISMTVGNHSIIMPWEDNDTVWAGLFNNNYIASWGPKAPSYEMRGEVDPAVFGLAQSYYVEFRFAALGGEPSDDCC
jgi:hypothetical protein